MAGNFTGINTAGIPSIRSALENYKKSIESYEIRLVGTQLGEALKGTGQVNEFKKLSQSCNDYKKNLLKLVDNCLEKISTIETEYKKNDETSTAVAEQSSVINKLKS